MRMVGRALAAAISVAMERERMDACALAGRIGERVEVLNQWMGDAKSMPLECVADIAAALGTMPSALFQDSPSPTLRGGKKIGQPHPHGAGK